MQADPIRWTVVDLRQALDDVAASGLSSRAVAVLLMPEGNGGQAG